MADRPALNNRADSDTKYIVSRAMSSCLLPGSCMPTCYVVRIFTVHLRKTTVDRIF